MSVNEGVPGQQSAAASPSGKMHIALGYRWAPPDGRHWGGMEAVFRAQGHRVTFVGPPDGSRRGYNGMMPVDQLISQLPEMPDFYLWLDRNGYFPPGIEKVPVPTACWLAPVHLGTAWRQQVARFFDVVFIAQKDYLEGFRRAVGHDQVQWLPWGAGPYLKPTLDVPRIYDVGFVGNIVWAHRNTARVRRLALLAERYGTNDLYHYYPLQEVADVYSQSRIVFNVSIAGDANLRVFEGTACGALVLTDSVANGLGDLFRIGDELVVYDDDADLVSKIDYYLDHEDERARIAAAGLERTRSEHLFVHRVQALMDTMMGASIERSAPMRVADREEREKARRDVLTHMHMLDAILDESRAAGYSRPKRIWLALPCLARRLLL